MNLFWGKKGEDLAVKYLKKNGYKILKRNFKTPFGEIDIIAEEKATIVFIEVKTRTNRSKGAPSEAITEMKKHRIRNSALYYASVNGADKAFRFDFIGVEDEKIEHIRDAFGIDF